MSRPMYLMRHSENKNCCNIYYIQFDYMIGDQVYHHIIGGREARMACTSREWSDLQKEKRITPLLMNQTK